MRTMTHKGYGRIFVPKETDIQVVKNVIKEMDEFEFDYLPDNYITTMDKHPQTVYTGKFDDLDMDELVERCDKLGIKVTIQDDGLSWGGTCPCCGR